MQSQDTNTLNDISEHQTRKKLIDPELEKKGWLKKYIKEEVNTVKSKFINKDYVTYNGTIEKGIDRFSDYVLLNEDFSVLAIIESKRFSKDEKSGRIQARTYAKDIENQTNRKIPIFLTNGAVWRFIDEEGIERRISGPFSQDDLKRRADLYKSKRNPLDVTIDSRIVNRDRNVYIVKKLSEHFSQGHRTALVQMATGTGKTRVAMALINLLISSNYIRNVLFIADRISLVNQAKSLGFKQFFSEPIVDLRGGFNTHGRLYVCTVQTLMSGDNTKFFENFSPGFFDLIIFDEAHRSIYDKNNIIMEYFDAIKVGLTATPREQEARNTYQLFGCGYGTPTVEYPYDDALRDKILVPYKALSIDTEILSDGVRGWELSSELKDQLIRQEQDPDITEFAGSDFDRRFMDKETNKLIVREFMSQCYKSDEGKPCKSIFFCACISHANLIKDTFNELFPLLGNEVQVITSDMARAEDEVDRFKLKSEPRIALSVGMLDTGIDVPEVCNLVFVKPVFSHIRFWQMLGRGTRNLDSCRNKTWLPNNEKNDFLILDFKVGGYSNIEMHVLSETHEKGPHKDVLTKTFENRVKLLNLNLNDKQKEIIINKIINTIISLGTESFLVREKLPIITEIIDNKQELEEYIDDLLDEISPLLILSLGENSTVASFVLQVERLFGYILNRRVDKLEEVRVYVQDMATNILRKDNLNIISENRDKIMRVLQERFWEELTFDDVEFILKEIAPLMKYYEQNPTRIVQVDAPDLILNIEVFEKEIREDEQLNNLLETNQIARKIRNGKGINFLELIELEKQLSSLRPELTIENVQKYQHKDFLVFLGDIIGLSFEYDPKEEIEKRFDELIIKKNSFNSKQIEFLMLLKKIFSERKHIEIKDFANSPLSDEHPLDYFRLEELEQIVNSCRQIRLL